MKATSYTLAALLAASALPSSGAEHGGGRTGIHRHRQRRHLSDYRFRGISQTNKKPAIQGGIDCAQERLYLGNWNSNRRQRPFQRRQHRDGLLRRLEDHAIEGFGLDLGALYYYYPGSGDNPGTGKIDNTELYIGSSWGPISLKFNYAVSDFFGVDDSKGAYYVLLSGVHDFGNGFGINGSVGYQGLKDQGFYTEMDGKQTWSVTDYKLQGTYTIDGWVLGLAYVSTNRDLSAGTAANRNRNISNGTALLSVTKSF